jgi:hypothetical protein
VRSVLLIGGLVTALGGCNVLGSPSITSGFDNEPEVHREDVGFDVHFCMRVEAGASETEQFVATRFSREDRISVPVDTFGKSCGASFWPTEFGSPTIAYDGNRSGSRGVVVDDGLLYFWDIGI